MYIKNLILIRYDLDQQVGSQENKNKCTCVWKCKKFGQALKQNQRKISNEIKTCVCLC